MLNDHAIYAESRRVELAELCWFLLGTSGILNSSVSSSKLPLFTLTSLFQAGICFLCIIYTYFRVPEPQGRSFAELDLLFERGVSARNFSSTNVDVFDQDVRADVVDKYEEQILVRPQRDAEKASYE